MFHLHPLATQSPFCYGSLVSSLSPEFDRESWTDFKEKCFNFFFQFVYLFFKEAVATTILLELQSSRPKVISPDVTLSETWVMLPEVFSYLARYRELRRPIFFFYLKKDFRATWLVNTLATNRSFHLWFVNCLIWRIPNCLIWRILVYLSSQCKRQSCLGLLSTQA